MPTGNGASVRTKVERIRTMDTKQRARAHELINEGKAIFQMYGDERLPPDETRRAQQILAELQALNDDDALKEGVKAMDRYHNEPASPMIHPSAGARGDGGKGESIGAQFVKSPACLSFDPAARRGPSSGFSTKALLDSATGWAPESVRTGRVEPAVSRPLNVLDIVGQGTTSQAAVVYMEETTATNLAAEVAEGAEKVESTLAFTERTASVRTIATVLPVTNQLLEDVQACSAYVDQRLAYFVKARLDGQLLVGDGVAPNLMGLCNVVGVQSQAKGADPTPDAVAKAADLVRVNGGYDADCVVFHPNDWQAVRLLRTADGIYIWGSPADAAPASIWGLRVVISSAITEGTALVGAFRQACQLFVRSDMAIAISDSHDDYFAKNKSLLRCEMRAAFAIYRPTAFCKVSGV